MSKSTFKILFYIRKNQVNKDGTVCIMVRLTVSGDVTQFSSKLNVDPKAWDVRLGKVAGNSVKARQLNVSDCSTTSCVFDFLLRCTPL